VAGVPRVIGYSPNPAEAVKALQATAITEIADSPVQVVRQCDLIILATPPKATLDLLQTLAPLVGREAILTDVCSVKAPIMRQALGCGLGDQFAGAHPLAGTHESGFVAARPDRLRGCVVYICETGSLAGHRAAAAVSGFWEEILGASPIRIDPEVHDRQLAWTSHLPQAIAYVLAKVLSSQGLGGVSFGSGARDTMRLAASSPELWVEVLSQNVKPVSTALEQTQEALAELRKLLSQGDEAGLRNYLTTAHRFRQGIER
jgi:prephenate dehydrogenase